MDLSFWLGKCVWDTHVVLWQKFGGSILDIYGVMRIARLDATVHRHSPARTGRMLTVYIRIKLQVDVEADKSSIVVKGPFFPRVMNPRY
jgi:hypothetical protein